MPRPSIPSDVAHPRALLAGAEVVVLDPLQLGSLARPRTASPPRVGRVSRRALDEAEQVRLDEQQPLHHDRARHALEPVRGLDREDVAVVQEVGDLVRVAP